jgi:hypothetical protein
MDMILKSRTNPDHRTDGRRKICPAKNDGKSSSASGNAIFPES